MRNILAFIPIMLALSGCVLEMGKVGLDMQAVLLGSSKSHIRSCAGAPKSVAQNGADEVWTYQRNAYLYEQMDRNYIGYMDITFSNNEVSDIQFRSNYQAGFMGTLSPTAISYLSAPLLEQC